MTDDRATYPVKAKYNYEDGTLEINIPEIIADLDEEDREELARLHTFDSAIWEEIKRSVKNQVASDGYYDTIHRLRIELLSGDGADKVLKATVRGILSDMKNVKRSAKYYRDKYIEMRRWCGDNLSLEQRSKMPDEVEWDDWQYIRDADVDKAIAEAQEKIDDRKAL